MSNPKITFDGRYLDLAVLEERIKQWRNDYKELGVKIHWEDDECALVMNLAPHHRSASMLDELVELEILDPTRIDATCE